MNYYDLLQVNPSACREVIEAAHRALIKQMHPDAGGSHQATLALNEAREVLLSPERRNRYDVELKLKSAKSDKHAEQSSSSGFKVVERFIERNYIICSECWNRNRVELERLNYAKCGHCGVPFKEGGLDNSDPSRKDGDEAAPNQAASGSSGNRGAQGRMRKFATEGELIQYIQSQRPNVQLLFVQQTQLFDKVVALSGWAELGSYFNYEYRGLSDEFFNVRLHNAAEHQSLSPRAELYFRKDEHQALAELLAFAKKPVPITAYLFVASERFSARANDLLAFGVDWEMLDYERRTPNGFRRPESPLEEDIRSENEVVDEDEDLEREQEEYQEADVAPDSARPEGRSRVPEAADNSRGALEPADYYYLVEGSQALLIPLLSVAVFAAFYFGRIPGQYARTVSDYAMYGLVSFLVGLLGGIGILFLTGLLTMLAQYLARFDPRTPAFRREIWTTVVFHWTSDSMKFIVPALSIAIFTSFYFGSGKKLIRPEEFIVTGIAAFIFGLIGSLCVLFLVGLLTFFVQLISRSDPRHRHSHHYR